MCNAVYFNFEGEDHRVYFTDTNAVLPVIRKDGSVSLLPWGRRLNEPGFLPQGGWANLQKIHEGQWDEWFPKPVRLQLSSFMETDYEGRKGWYDITRGKYIQGLVAREKDEFRVYVVTIIPERIDAEHERWPRIVS